MVTIQEICQVVYSVLPAQNFCNNSTFAYEYSIFKTFDF